MITYEDAKERALEIAEQVGVSINCAKELPDAYVFDDTENEYAGWAPMVIRKSDGMKFPYWHYIQDNNVDVKKDMKEIPF